MAEKEGKEERTGEALAPWRPWSGLRELEEEVERLMDAVWGGRPWRPLVMRPTLGEWYPAMDVFRRDDALVIKAELPGLSPEDVEITATEDELTISGEKSSEEKVEEEDYYRCERRYGRFTRRVPLPAGADADKAKAVFKAGVLEVSIPLKGEPRKKKVEIVAST